MTQVGVNFDGALKEFFEQRRPSLLMDLTGGVAVKESLNVELPRVPDRRVDLVLLLANETLLHIEFQSTNRKDMTMRMAEYYMLLLARYKRPIQQVVLYVGHSRMRMESVLEHGPLRFSHTLKDIREWTADSMLASDRFADHVLAILGGTSGGRDLVREVLSRLARLESKERNRAMAYLAALSGFRRFETRLVQEAKRMDVVIDLEEELDSARNPRRRAGRRPGRGVTDRAASYVVIGFR